MQSRRLNNLMTSIDINETNTTTTFDQQNSFLFGALDCELILVTRHNIQKQQKDSQNFVGRSI